MAYLPGFNHDIFISYAYPNNQYPKDWVTRFHTGLELILNSTMRGVTIWRDNDLDGNIRFDVEIEERIRGAAIFITLYSRAYRDSDYCRKELRTFYQKAQQTDDWGLDLGPGKWRRIVNVLLHDIAHEEWPVEFQGIAGHKFYGPSGWPLNQEGEEYETQLQALADDLINLLQAFKEILTSSSSLKPQHPRTTDVPAPEETSSPSPSPQRISFPQPPSQMRRAQRIFMSYRRDDTAPYAGRVHDHLVPRFGKDAIFMDIDTIEPGEDFVEVIEKAVAACDILIALIGKQWLTCADQSGLRRLDNPNDFVRLEIATALKRKIRVIPVLVEGAMMPGQADLPEDLESLARRQGIELSYKRWKQDMAKLIEVLEKVLST